MYYSLVIHLIYMFGKWTEMMNEKKRSLWVKKKERERKRLYRNSNTWRFPQALNRVISLVANLKQHKITVRGISWVLYCQVCGNSCSLCNCPWGRDSFYVEVGPQQAHYMYLSNNWKYFLYLCFGCVWFLIYVLKNQHNNEICFQLCINEKGSNLPSGPPGELLQASPANLDWYRDDNSSRK